MYIEKLKMETTFTFDDVLLEPAESWVEPYDADVRSRFSRNIPLNIPLVSASHGYGYRVGDGDRHTPGKGVLASSTGT